MNLWSSLTLESLNISIDVNMTLLKEVTGRIVILNLPFWIN